MALPLLTEQRITGFKVEATYGTAESITATEAVTAIFDTDMNPVGDFNRKPGQSALSPLQGSSGAIYQRATFKSELHGGFSASPPGWGALLQACGMAVSTATYTPQSGSASAKSVTVGLFQDGNYHAIAGAMGNFVMTGESGKPVVIEWDFMGKYIADATAALITPTYLTGSAPNFMGATLTIGGTAYEIQRFTLSPNNEVQMREKGNGPTDATFGYLGAYIPRRRWSMTVNPESVLQSTKDWMAQYVAGTTAALVLTIGSSSNNTQSITAPALQLAALPRKVNLNGKQVTELEFDLVRSASAADDEFQLVFS